MNSIDFCKQREKKNHEPKRMISINGKSHTIELELEILKYPLAYSIKSNILKMQIKTSDLFKFGSIVTACVCV